ncbi:MAG TPA: shikimate kinase [Anaerolineales bacterium]|nr:shikimate kinase [Anaerolineales bacterium]
MGSAVILIGPVRTGKSTVGSLLATKLTVPFYELDDLRFGYYNEIGYDRAEAKRRIEREGFWGLYRYWKPFEAYAVERLLKEHQEGVIAFGAGHSVYEDDVLFERVRAVMAPFPRVVLLLPSPDLGVTMGELRARDTDAPVTEPDINEHFVRHHSNYDLAKEVVYTLGRTAEETCDEIRRRFGL